MNGPRGFLLRISTTPQRTRPGCVVAPKAECIPINPGNVRGDWTARGFGHPSKFLTPGLCPHRVVSLRIRGGAQASGPSPSLTQQEVSHE